jgi:hypothetical protein
MSKKTIWCCFILYLAIFGSFCGFEIDTYVEDLPLFQWTTLLLFFNILFVLLIPPLVYAILYSIPSLWNRRVLRNAVLTANSVYFIFAILFSLYKSARNMDFDFYFFWYNLSVALSVLWKLYAPWLLVIVLCVAGFVYFQKVAFAPIVSVLKKSPNKAWPVFAGIVGASLLCQLITVDSVRGSTVGFLYASFFSDRHLRNEYRTRYEAHMQTLQSRAAKISGNGNASLLGDIVIMVQQESLNSLLLGPRITPQILRASREGVLLNPIYGNSIQSERGYECILCGVPPSIGGDLVDDYSVDDLKHLSCLPRIFKGLGYRPIVFYSGNRNPRVMRLFEAIGFEKILAGEITQPEDTMYDWGYREDTFFTRVDQYLQKHYTNEKLFIFITASATNHTPFKVHDERFLDRIPYPDPRSFVERFSNTTFVQDAYFGHLFDLYTRHYAQRASLIALSDHSWPIERHKHNIYNERGAYEENFLAAMLFVPPIPARKDFAVGATVPYRYSQMDILPSFLDLIGLKQNLWLGESFAPWLLSSPAKEQCAPQTLKVSVQPYGGGYISVVRYPQKYLFDVLGKDVKTYNLQTDPGELSPVSRQVEQYIHLISEFFKPSSSKSMEQTP